MSRRANPTLIGGFVLGAAVLAVAGVMLLGSGALFTERERFVMYFDESIQGLTIGDPVILRGVRIGSVSDIRVVVDEAAGEVQVPVYIELSRERVQVVNERSSVVQRVQNFAREEGLRAQLAMQSIVTGKLYVSLVFRPETPLRMVGDDRHTPELPTIPSELEEVKTSLAQLFDDLRSLPVAEVVEEVRATLASVRELAGSEEIRDAVVHLDEALVQLRDLGRTLNARGDEVLEDTSHALVQTRRTMEVAEEALANLDRLVQPESPLAYRLERALTELERAVRVFRALADDLARQPDQLIYGRGGGTEP